MKNSTCYRSLLHLSRMLSSYFFLPTCPKKSCARWIPKKKKGKKSNRKLIIWQIYEKQQKRENVFFFLVITGNRPENFTFSGIYKARARLDCCTGLTSEVKGNKLLLAVPAKTQQTSHRWETRVFESPHCGQVSCLPEDQAIIFVRSPLFFFFF